MSSMAKTLTLTGIFTALIFVFTAFVHIPSFTGYVHIGDSFLFLAASVLPHSCALYAGAAGAALADCLTGFAAWTPGSLIIKGVTVFFFTREESTFLCRRNLLALIPAAVLCIVGYYLYEAFLFGNFAAPVYGMIGNLGQAVFSSAVYLLVGKLLDRSKVKSRLIS